MNISLEEVEASLLRQKIEPAKVSSIIKDLQQVIEENKSDKQPKEKWEYVIILNDPNGAIKADSVAGWVVQQKENEDAGIILSKLSDAAREQNEAATKMKNTLVTMTDIFSGLKGKFLKPKNIRIKTKELTRVLVTK